MLWIMCLSAVWVKPCVLHLIQMLAVTCMFVNQIHSSFTMQILCSLCELYIDPTSTGFTSVHTLVAFSTDVSSYASKISIKLCLNSSSQVMSDLFLVTLLHIFDWIRTVWNYIKIHFSAAEKKHWMNFNLHCYSFTQSWSGHMVQDFPC